MKYLQILLFPYLLAKALSYRAKALKQNLIGKEFLNFGYKFGMKLFGKHKEAFNLALTPVSIVRYFEFDYCAKALFPLPNGSKVLDVSSPYLFGFYASGNFDINYKYINPDKRDTENVRSMADFLPVKGTFKTFVEDATNLDYADNSFDNILSISVIEHINGTGDSAAIKELWRVLKPGGKLVLTFPIKKEFFEEYRSNNVYELDSHSKDGKYFFQRFYDEEAIQKRLLNQISDYAIASKNVFGEKRKGFFEEYEGRWLAKKHFETIKDPFYISSEFQSFNSIEELPGIGVLGLTLIKN